MGRQLVLQAPQRGDTFSLALQRGTFHSTPADSGGDSTCNAPSPVTALHLGQQQRALPLSPFPTLARHACPYPPLTPCPPPPRSIPRLQSMALKDGSRLVAMSVLPSGVVPEEEVAGGEEEQEEEEEGAAAPAGSKEAEEQLATSGQEDFSPPWLLLVSVKVGGVGQRQAGVGWDGVGSGVLSLAGRRPLPACHFCFVSKRRSTPASWPSIRARRSLPHSCAHVPPNAPFAHIPSHPQGQGKRVPISHLRLLKGRIGKGNKVMGLGKDDRLAAAVVVGVPQAGGSGAESGGGGSMDDAGSDGEGAHDVVVSTAQGLLVRLSMEDIKLQRRPAKGVRVIKLAPGDEVSTVTLVRRKAGATSQ